MRVMLQVQQLSNNIFHILNVSLALFFVVWQLIMSLCMEYRLHGDGYISKCSLIPYSLVNDNFFIITFYLIILSLVIFLFLLASEKFYERVTELRYVFLAINVFFIFILFFEI